MGMPRFFVAALSAGLLSSACDADLQPTSGEVLTTAGGAITASATTAEETATTDDATVEAEPTQPAAGPGTTEPLYKSGPCGRSPTLAPYLYAKLQAKHAHACNVIALETSRETGLWLFGAYRSDTGECCLFLQPNSRH